MVHTSFSLRLLLLMAAIFSKSPPFEASGKTAVITGAGSGISSTYLTSFIANHGN